MDRTTLLIDAIGLVLIALASVLIPFIKSVRRFSGYKELRSEAMAIQRFLRGELFRDSNDLVITGNVDSYRTTLRFSQDEYTPGVNIRMEVPATFDLAIAPKNAESGITGQPIRTGNDAFDASWVVRTNERTQAKIFLAGDNSDLYRLCCSSKTFLNVQRGVMELSELTVPEEAPAQHLIAHLQSMGRLGKQLSHMPGASQIKIERVVPPRKTSRALVIVIAVIAVCMGVATLADYQREQKMNSAREGAGGSPRGIPSEEAIRIPNLEGWRLAESPDFDPSMVDWLHSKDVQADGRLEGDFSGSGQAADHAYLLINSEGAHRLVVLINNEPKFNEIYPSAAVIAKVPKQEIPEIKISAGSIGTGTTDGILLVRDKNDAHSGVLLSFQQGSPVIAIPDDFHKVEVK